MRVLPGDEKEPSDASWGAQSAWGGDGEGVKLRRAVGELIFNRLKYAGREERGLNESVDWRLFF